MKMTPGPWKASLYDSTTNSVRVKGPEGQTVAFCCPPYVFENRKQMITECVCNSIGVAALPELLEAAQGARFVVNSNPTLHYLRNEPWFKRLDDAIQKAKGET